MAIPVNLAARGLVNLGPPNGGVGLGSLHIFLGSGICHPIGTGTSVPFTGLIVGKTVIKAIVEAVIIGRLIVDAIVIGAFVLWSSVCCTINMGTSTPFARRIVGEAVVEAIFVGRLIVDAIVVAPLIARIVVTCVVLTEDGRGHGGSRRAVPCAFLPGSGSGSTGLAVDGKAPIV